MAHSNQVREFVLSDRGIDLVDVYLGGGEVLTGSARLAQEGRERLEAVRHRIEHEQKLRQSDARRRAIEAQIAVLQSELDAASAERNLVAQNEVAVEHETTRSARDLARRRGDQKAAAKPAPQS